MVERELEHPEITNQVGIEAKVNPNVTIEDLNRSYTEQLQCELLDCRVQMALMKKEMEEAKKQ